MKRWLNKIEHFVDFIIPYALILLAILIIGELFYEELIHPYLTLVNIIDWIIIGVFVIDLTFKWFRIRNIKGFVKRYWLDIIAVMPFFLVFRLLEEIGETFIFVREWLAESQKILHVGVGAEKEIVEIEKGTSKIISEAERLGKLSRTERFARFLRPIARLPRFLRLGDKDTKKRIEFIEKKAEKKIKKEEHILEKIYKRLVKVFVFFERPKNK